mgnify:CR=1 FL=1
MKPVAQEKVLHAIQESNPLALFADGLEKAIIGIAIVWGDNGQKHVVAYSVQKVIEIFMKENDWSFDEALEYAEYNTFGAYVGENTPVFVDELYNMPEEMYEL